jgi:hypothetical protein
VRLRRGARAYEVEDADDLAERLEELAGLRRRVQPV